jgi:molybdopterin converting factor small subunit
MSVATVRLNGLLSLDSAVKTNDKKNTYPMLFKGKRIKLTAVLSKMALYIPREAVAFVAINGIKVTGDSWVMDGDMIDIFPIVTGG